MVHAIKHIKSLLRPPAKRSGEQLRSNKEKRGAKAIVKSRTSPEARKRAHVKRMLARAEKRSRQALRIVQKWKARLTELDRAQVAEKQATLWHEEHPPQG